MTLKQNATPTTVVSPILAFLSHAMYQPHTYFHSC